MNIDGEDVRWVFLQQLPLHVRTQTHLWCSRVSSQRLCKPHSRDNACCTFTSQRCRNGLTISLAALSVRIHRFSRVCVDAVSIPVSNRSVACPFMNEWKGPDEKCTCVYFSLSVIRLAFYGVSSQKAKIIKFLTVTNVEVPLLLAKQERVFTAAMFIIAIIITLQTLALRNDLDHHERGSRSFQVQRLALRVQ